METVEPIRSAEALDRFLDYLRRQSLRNHMLALLGFNTGIRIGDELKLKVYDVSGTHLKIRATKTGKEVRVLLHEPLKRALEIYTAGMDPQDYLFPSRESFNKPITRSRAYQILNEAAAACGLRHIGCHSMRKTFGYWFYKRTGDIAMLQELLGHTHPSVTLRYIGITSGEIDAAMKSFSIGF